MSANAITGSFRGIIAIDPVAGHACWVRPMGVTTMPFVVADINGDGLDEFVLSSYSPENGVSFSGMTDAGTAYVICLDWYGNVLWRRPFYGEYRGRSGRRRRRQRGRRPGGRGHCEQQQAR